jgi:hypothetical protein
MRFLIMDAKLTKINQNFNKLIEYFIVCTIFCYKITFKSLNSIHHGVYKLCTFNYL